MAKKAPKRLSDFGLSAAALAPDDIIELKDYTGKVIWRGEARNFLDYKEWQSVWVAPGMSVVRKK